MAYKEDGNPETQWGIIVLEDHKIKYCYNVIAKDVWLGFPIEEKVTIDMHIFRATQMEVDFADYYMHTERMGEYVDEQNILIEDLREYNRDIENSTWHKIAAKLRKFFSA